MADRAAIEAGTLDGDKIAASSELRDVCHGPFSLPPHLKAKRESEED